jgi:hypothetical protein
MTKHEQALQRRHVVIRLRKLTNFFKSQSKRLQCESEELFFKDGHEGQRREGQAQGINWCVENLEALLKETH